MQDRYVGDVGDFAKYALLRSLIGHPGGQPVRLGVVWCRFPDEQHNNDGRHVSYLRAAQFANLDGDVLDVLKKIVESNGRSISAVANSGIMPAGTVFCDALTTPLATVSMTPSTRLAHRSDWLAACLSLTRNCDLVFLDPDNGIEAASVPKHHPKSGKYIYWDELRPFWRRGQALLIYHHTNRTKSVAEQVRQLTARIKTEFTSSAVLPLVFRRGSCRVFWLVHNQSAPHTQIEQRAIDFLRSDWSKHFRPHPWPT